MNDKVEGEIRHRLRCGFCEESRGPYDLDADKPCVIFNIATAVILQNSELPKEQFCKENSSKSVHCKDKKITQ